MSDDRLAVTHAITLKGSTLTDLILKGEKPVENRSFAIKPGWVALHNNADYSDLRTSLVGVARFAHAVPARLVREPVRAKYADHVQGPMCNVIAEVQRLKEPIPSVRGALSVWKLKDEDRALLQAQLRAASDTLLTGFEREFERPQAHELAQLKRKRSGPLACSRDLSASATSPAPRAPEVL